METDPQFSTEGEHDTNPVEYIVPNFSADAFAGTAAYYLRYRVPYPDILTNDLIERANVTGQGRLLDLACGPGRVAFALARSFQEVLAIDLESEMIEVGKQDAGRRGLHNIVWMIGKAEDLRAEPGSFELIAIGDAFHRLDQQRIAQQTLEWLQPGCCLAILGGYSLTAGQEPWQRLVSDAVAHWTKSAREDGAMSERPQPQNGPIHSQRVLREAGFAEIASHPFVVPYTWTIDAIIGHLYSTTFCSKRILGDKAAAFEGYLTAVLLAYDASGKYDERMRFGYTLGRKPK